MAGSDFVDEKRPKRTGDSRTGVTTEHCARPSRPQLFHDDLICIARVMLWSLAMVAMVVAYHAGSTSWLLYILPGTGFLYRRYRRSIALPNTKWAGEIVLITGGGTGIGAMLALKLSQRAKVVVLTNCPPTYEESIPNIYTYICDVADRDEIARIAATIRKEVGEPTIVVNNAGVVKGKLLLDLTTEDIQSTFNVNTVAPFYIIQEFLPHMLRARHGHIVNVASVLGLLGVAQMTDYCASKAATVAMHACLRNELDYRYHTPEVRTTLVLPGHILTSMFAKTVIPQSWLLRLLAPSLKPEVVVDSIAVALEGGDSAKVNTVLRLPFFTHSARLLSPVSALVPSPILRLSHWVSNGDWAMRPYGPTPDYGERLMAERKPKELDGGSKSSG